MTFRLPPLVQRELEPLGERWRLEPGAKHYKLLIDGHLITIFPRASVIRDSRDRVVLNTRAQIRRYVGRHP